MAPGTTLGFSNTMNKPACPDVLRQPAGSRNSGGAVPPTPSKIPLPPSPIRLKAQFINTPNETQERPPLKTSTSTSSMIGASTNASSTNGLNNGYGLPAQSNGFPSLIFPPTTHQAYHTRNLLLHIYSMFNGAQAAIHQLGANCEFNQNLITFLSSQLVDRDRKIQTLTASVNMLQTAVQRAMKNNEELKKTEEGLQDEIKTLRSGNRSDVDLTTRVEKLIGDLRIQTEEKARLLGEHNTKIGEMEKEMGDLRENIEILEESLRYAVSLRFNDDEPDMDETNELLPNHPSEQSRHDDGRAEKMMNGRLDDASAESDDSLIDEVNGANGEHVVYTDGASNGGYIKLGSTGRTKYLDSITEESEEEDLEEGEIRETISKFPAPPCAPPTQPITSASITNTPTSVPASRGVTKLRATAKPFVNEMEFHYINDENIKAEAEGSALFL
ncbi:hypothetical protein H072_3708 [Dactylellina haptotyla CBS 200.50]|uniref:Uncharacterized protein n=1 Tax=Dactylellina haptotyla (strain CBS 200.50) TaxID=1284197 RepID=S8AML1_DACHA|nr:hypothetical protein H072_3708 [Dactylellina haptotyla CBS 200.50]